MQSAHIFVFAFLLLSGRSLSLASPLVFVTSFGPGAKGAIHACHLDATAGVLEAGRQVAQLPNPYYLALSPDRRFLYSICADNFGSKEEEAIEAFRITDSEGSLQPLNRRSTRGSASCFLWIEPTGQTMLVANYASSSIASLPVHADGSLGEIVSFHRHVGKVFDPVRQGMPHPHAIIPSPDNRFALVPDLGLDRIAVYTLDVASSKLTPHEPPFVEAPQRSGPRHLVFHPNGHWLYVINEIANSVTRYDYHAARGTLTRRETISTLPAGYDGRSNCADLRITPDGRFLYASNRTHDSIACYTIAADGVLSLIEIRPSLGGMPQDLCITPDGRLLLCANMRGDNVAAFRIDAHSGRLEPAGEPLPVHKPSCILLLP
ncbi:MAG: lactonase family protein [Opitutaceae bacterium]|nr:lactonase family protein [Opitutaceae bacterium]